MPTHRTRRLPAAIALSLTLGPTVVGTALAYEVNERLEVNLLLAAGGQCQEVSGDTEAANTCRGAVLAQPEVFFKPTKHDQVFFKLGFAGGNALDPVSPFALSAWDADLEDGVKHINHSDRSYLLEAWYAHTFQFSEHNSLQITGGILDPAFYVNENAFANNPNTQFMNEAFVNAHTAFIPDFDWGGALVWKVGGLTLTGIGMNVYENDEGRNYSWYTAEADYNLKTALGEGNYRVMYSWTTKAFDTHIDPLVAPDPEAGADPDDAYDLYVLAPSATARRQGWALSFDQELGRVLGVFLRLNRQDDEAVVDYQNEYSGGFNFNGRGWGREDDNIGLGYAYLDGGNDAIDSTQVFEGYYRFTVNKFLALTADVQYMQDEYQDDRQVSGWIWGLRAVTEF